MVGDCNLDIDVGYNVGIVGYLFDIDCLIMVISVLEV